MRNYIDSRSLRKLLLCLCLSLVLIAAAAFALPLTGYAASAEPEQTGDTTESVGDIAAEPAAAPVGQTQITEIVEGAGDGQPVEGDPATEPVYTNDAVPAEPVNGEAGETLPEAFDPEANKAAIEPLLTTTETAPEPRNAIQKAIDAALENIEADTKEITVTVDPGVYEGDIEINAKRSYAEDTTTFYRDADGNLLGSTQEKSVQEQSYVIPDDFILKIVARDAGASLLEAGDSVKVNGNVNISDLNVLMAGLYFSINKIITVKNEEKGDDVKVEVYGTAADDNINLSAGNGTDVTVHGGAGSDTLTLDSGPGAKAALDGGGGDDSLSVASLGEGTPAAGSVSVSGGAGSDVVTVDVSLADSVNSNVSVYANSAAAPADVSERDRLHLSGALKANGEGSSASLNTTADSASFALKNSGGKTLDLSAYGFKSYTDELRNKRTGALLSAGSFDSLCDYVYDLGLGGGELDLAVNGGGLLVSFIISTAGDMTVKKLEALNANARLMAKDITVTGVINVSSLEAIGRSFTVAESGSVAASGDVLLNMSDDDTLFNVSSATSTPILSDLGVSASGSLLDLLARSSITVAGTITAGGNVRMRASTEQSRSLLDLTVNGNALLKDLNFLNIKSGKAEINVPGSIIAGGGVTAEAGSAIAFTVSSASIAGITVPVSLSIAVSQVGVNVTGSIIAGGDVLLSAVSDVDINTMALTGKLPVTLAVSIAAVDCHVTVGGGTDTLVRSNNGSVTLASHGVTSLYTKAGRGDSQGTDKIGVSAYFAAGVGVVDISARVIGDADVIAENGKVSIRSHSDENAIAYAVSKREEPSGTGAQGGDNPSIESIKNSLMTLLGGFTTQLGAKFGAVSESIEGKDYRIWTADTVNGTVSAVNMANAGQSVTVTAAPNKGYKLKSLQYKYLPAGASAYTLVPIAVGADGSYTVTMPAFDITLVGEFEKKTAQELGVTQDEYDDLYDVSGLFGGEDDSDAPADPTQDADEDGLGLSELFNEGAGAASTVDGSRATENSTAADAITIAVAEGVNNAEGVVKGGSILTPVTKIDAGRSVAITVNPTKAGATATQSYKLKPGTLSFTYLRKAAAGDSSSAAAQPLNATVEIVADEKGEYVFTVPADISDTDRTITLHAEWEQLPVGVAPAEPQSQASASMQITGALAFSVTVNRNSAVVSTSGEIRAAEADISAEATTDANATADATDALDLAVEQGLVPGTTQAGLAATTGAQWVDKRDRLVLIDTMANGSLVYKSESSTDNSYVFEVVPLTGFELASLAYPGGAAPARYALLSYTKADGSAGTAYLLTNTVGTITTAVSFDLATLDGGYKKGTTLTLSAAFVEKAGATATAPGTVPAEYVGVQNTIMIAGTQNGTVSFVSSASSPTSGKYAFNLTPATGYRLGEIPAATVGGAAEINFTYSYTRAATPAVGATPAVAEAVVKTSLSKDSGGNYFFQLPTDAKPGTGIVISAVFVEDTRDIVLDSTMTGGSIAVVPAEGETVVTPAASAAPGAPVVVASAKAGDTVRFTAKAVDGYKPGAMQLKYFEGAVEKTLTLTLEQSTGVYSFTMPATEKGKSASISCAFARKDIPVAIESATVGESSASTTENLAAVTLESARVDVGGVVTVLLTEAGLAKGYKLTGITGHFVDASQTESLFVGMEPSSEVKAVLNADGSISFTIPRGDDPDGLNDFIGLDADGIGFKLAVKLAEKAIAVDVTASDRGAISVSNNKADVGDTVSITLAPNTGYRTTDNSVSVTVVKAGTGGAAGSSVTTRATRGTDGKYTFVVPAGTTGLEVAAEFMIGDEAANTRGDSVSIGVAATLSVTTHSHKRQRELRRHTRRYKARRAQCLRQHEGRGGGPGESLRRLYQRRMGRHRRQPLHRLRPAHKPAGGESGAERRARDSGLSGRRIQAEHRI